MSDPDSWHRVQVSAARKVKGEQCGFRGGTHRSGNCQELKSIAGEWARSSRDEASNVLPMSPKETQYGGMHL